MAAHDENAQPSPGQAALPTLASLTRSRPRRPGSFGVERLNSPAAAKLRAADAKGVLSPPPEEILKPQMSTTPARDSKPSSGGSSGRKRVRSLNTLAHAESAPSQPAPASPNPKSRKQQKTVSSSARAAASNLGSPTKPRRKAQQSGGSSNAGSSPVRYSPPREQFTPPRIVYLPVEQPASRRRGRSRSTSRARSTTPAKATRALRSPTPGRRTALIPPGSPGDDPILLVGPEPDWSAHARDLEPQPKEEEVDVAIPPTPLKPARTTPEDSPAHVSIFEAPIAPDDAFARMGNDTAASWDSTDDEQEENEHPASDVVEEFDVPLKQDPPTARTKARMDRFGRPTSPYPLQRGNNSVIAEDDEEDEDGDKKMTVLPDPDSPLSSRHSHSSHSNTATPSRRLSGIRRLSQARLRFSSVEGDDAQPAAQQPSLPALDEDVQMSDEQAPPASTSPEETPAQRGPGRVPLSESSSGESFTKHGEREPDVSTAAARPATPRGRRTLREMSFDFDGVPARSTQDSMARSTQDSMVAVDASDDESEVETGPGVIQISSSDPIAAARAAAILKKHHQYIQEGIRRRQSRSHSRSRASSAGRGSPAFSVVSNNDLLRLTEAEIELESALGSPSKHPAQAPRTWTKDDWKLLDASFSAVREEQGLDVDEVEPKMVVDRFFAVLAEEGRGVSFEELAGEWTWDKILRRVIALRAKQRGNPASSVAATPRSSRAPSETPSMRVPDFTPQVVRGMYPRLGALRRPDFDAARGTPPPPTPRSGVPAHGTFEFPRKVSANVKDVPPQLVGLAPRYNTPARPQAAVHPPPGVFVPPSTPQRAQASAPEPPPSTAKRMMGYLSSWLGVAKPQPQPKLPQPSRAGLPPPPPYLPRAVATPPRRPGERPPAPSVPLHAPPPAIREPAPEAVLPRDAVALQHAQPVRRERARVVPHKETVELQHAELVQHTPARAPNPREMVELHHVSPPPSTRKIAGPTVGAMRNRTASGGSVKDMVKNFEAVAQEKERRRNADLEAAKAKMRRTKSLQSLSGLAQGSDSGSGMTRTASVSGIPRPAWR